MLDKLAQHFQSNFYPDMAVEDVRAHLDNPEVLNNAFNNVAENGHDDAHVESIAKGNSKRKAQKGYREKSFTKGGTWKIVKDLKDYKTHEQGGVDLVIGKKGVEVKNGKTQFYAKDGLVMPNDPQDEIQPIDNFDKRVANTFTPEQKAKIKEHEDWISNFITSPRYKEMIINQGLDKDATDKLIQERLGNVKSTTYGNEIKHGFNVPSNQYLANTSNKDDKRGYNVHLPHGVFDSKDSYTDYPSGSNPITHELTHMSLGFTNSDNITPFAKNKIANMMQNTEYFDKGINITGFDKIKDLSPKEIEESGNDYWTAPTEVLSRLNSARKMLQENGVYDPNTEELNADKYQKFKDNIQKNIDILEGSDEKNIARNETQYNKLIDMKKSLMYLNDLLKPEEVDRKRTFQTNEQNNKIKDDTHKKVVWMLNNLVHNDTKGENTNV